MGDRADMLSSDRICNNYNKLANCREVHSPSSASVEKAFQAALRPAPRFVLTGGTECQPLRHGR